MGGGKPARHLLAPRMRQWGLRAIQMESRRLGMTIPEFFQAELERVGLQEFLRMLAPYMERSKLEELVDGAVGGHSVGSVSITANFIRQAIGEREVGALEEPLSNGSLLSAPVHMRAEGYGASVDIREVSGVSEGPGRALGLMGEGALQEHDNHVRVHDFGDTADARGGVGGGGGDGGNILVFPEVRDAVFVTDQAGVGDEPDA